MPLMVLAGTLIGAQLAPSVAWATAPIALMITGTAISVVPVTQLMRKLGRKRGMLTCMGVGIFGCLLAIAALQSKSFGLFCTASVVLGSLSAALMQGRFAAMESVSMQHHASATSMVMGGGIVAAFIGPELAILGREMSAITYQGSFLLGIGCIVRLQASGAEPLQPQHPLHQIPQHKSRRQQSICCADPLLRWH